jgi:protease I
MSAHALSQKTIALLACSGFDEQPFVSLQQALVAKGATVKIISRDNGLTNGWSNGVWGLSYPVDAALSETLAIDYDILVVPTGERHSTMLLNDPHGRRVVNAFLREDAPAVVIGSSIKALQEKDLLDGHDFDETCLSVSKNLVLAPEDTDTDSVIAALTEVVESGDKAAAA